MQLIFYCHSLLVASNLSDARRMVNFHKLITSEFHQQGCESAGAPSKCKSELLKQNFCFCKLFHQCIHFCSDKGLKRGFQSLDMSFCAVLQNPNCKSLDVIKDSWNKEGKSTKNVYCSGQLLFLNSWIHLSTFYVIVSLFSIWMTDQQQYKQNCPTQWLYHILSPSTKIEITAARLAIPILLLHTATMTLPQLHIIYTSTYGVSAAAIFF